MDDSHPREDRNFDDLADRFAKNIYGTTKGRIRLALLTEDLQENLPGLYEGDRPLEILDAGCGMAQMGCELAAKGHRVHFCDLSERMLDLAGTMASEAGVTERCSFHHGPFQAFINGKKGAFDVILFHAVLEWLVEPRASLETLVGSLAPGGSLSLMFYNVNCLIHRNAILGNFRKVMSGEFGGFSRSFTPLHPLDPSEVETWVAGMGLTVLRKTGVRVFTEYMRKDVLKDRSYEDTLEVERAHCRKEPFASMGRYVHLLCRKEME
ncbi:methyltransferase domain-containing protein [Desulfoluna butyratoxydans]|uniref:S-adenosyl-l-methionine-dependent methyltransferase n=1 Tax=Desulfoluna butyratoxydans TaxID=231438 RepID=A0A4U8YRQ4_9BACT|nr:methyltransferase domain-containing protein [Desulfoluna butyratoxydans]VFQ44482.1 s-adenosyl-l-methionine-dependent methyltransferase [Desulfoluna butyratoxydans]